MRTETVEVIGWFGKEYEGTYVFKEISWAKRNRIIQKYTKYHPLTGQVVSSDYVAIQAETIWASLKEQPENSPISLEKLLSEDDGVPFELGELFSQTVNGLCNVSVDETRFLSEQSDEENRTQRSRSLGSAKSSGSRQRCSGSSRRKQSKRLC
ncbi:MAG: hypothetical protein NWF04_02015 [Candidatus Bathyarchaeota archaeon]|nr:hypothetical protein [Candidatus Bathyarchaeota archaeon]